MNNNYISQYNKNNYKQYIFRVRKDDKKTITKLDSIKNKNNYFYNLINSDSSKKTNVLTIKQIKQTIKPILNKYSIKEIYLFGSYARGEANNNSDIDIYCEKGEIKTFFEQAALEEELEKALNKHVDVIFTSSTIDEYFKQQMSEDLIKLC